MKEKDDWTLTDALHHEHGRGDPFAAAVRATRMPMIVTDPLQPDNPIVFANQAFQTLTGYQRDEVIGRNCRFLQGTGTDRAAVDRIRQAIQRGESIDVDLLNYRKDGSRFWNALYISPVRGDDGRIRFFFASQMDVTARVEEQSRISREKDRIEAEVNRRVAELRSSLDAQRMLLHEVDHRVKNNMTMIGSILRLQMREAEDPQTVHLLQTMMTRIDALATVHRHLYQAEDVTRFDIVAYAVNLASDLVQAQAVQRIRIRADLARAEVPPGQASAVGLIINEILTQTIQSENRHDGESVITVSAWTEQDDIHLTLATDSDNGAPRDVTASGLGAQIISRLSRQARSSVRWSATGSGINVHITVSRESE